MPIEIPKLESSVDTRALPGVRLPTDTPSAAFGVQSPSIIPREALSALAQAAQEARRKADEVALIDTDRQLAEIETRLLHDPQKGALQRRGQDAFRVPEEMRAEWQQATGDIGKGFTGERARRFEAMVNRRFEGMDRAVQTHVGREIQAYDNDVTKGLVSNEINAAIAGYEDPTRIADATTRIRSALTTNATRNGLPPAERDRQILVTLSTMHAGVLDRMTSVDVVGGDARAREYYTAHKDEISGADQAKIEKTLAEATIRGESQREADTIVGQHSDMSEALRATKTIAEPRLRDAVRERVRQHFSDVDAARRLAEERRYLSATNLIDGQPGQPARSVIPAGMWSQLTLEQRNALERRSEGPSMPNNDKVWLDFLDLDVPAVAALSRAAFETTYWSHLDQVHRERAAAMWDQARDASAGRASLELSATLTYKDRVDNVLRSNGIISASKERSKFTRSEAELYARFETEAARRIEHFELAGLGGKRRATGEEMQKILDEMIIQRVFIDRNIIRKDPSIIVGVDTVATNERGDVYVPFAMIPKPERERIRALLQKNKKPTLDSVIERAFGAVRIGDRKLFDELVGNPTQR